MLSLNLLLSCYYVPKYCMFSEDNNLDKVKNDNDILSINNFIETYFMIVNKERYILLTYYDKDYNRIGYVKYCIDDGQICTFYLENIYFNKGIEKQIIDKIIFDMKCYGQNKIWINDDINILLITFYNNNKFIYKNGIYYMKI